jgi:hypothetical protein
MSTVLYLFGAQAFLPSRAGLSKYRLRAMRNNDKTISGLSHCRESRLVVERRRRFCLRHPSTLGRSMRRHSELESTFESQVGYPDVLPRRLALLILKEEVEVRLQDHDCAPIVLELPSTLWSFPRGEPYSLLSANVRCTPRGSIWQFFGPQYQHGSIHDHSRGLLYRRRRSI